MPVLDFTFNIPEGVINGYRMRYPKISTASPDDKEFMTIMIKGALKVSYLDARNNVWNSQNIDSLKAEIEGI